MTFVQAAKDPIAAQVKKRNEKRCTEEPRKVFRTSSKFSFRALIYNPSWSAAYSLKINNPNLIPSTRFPFMPLLYLLTWVLPDTVGG